MPNTTFSFQTVGAVSIVIPEGYNVHYDNGQITFQKNLELLPVPERPEKILRSRFQDLMDQHASGFSSKIDTIRLLREIVPNCGLKEAKEFMDSIFCKIQVIPYKE